ncbi:MAG: trehalose-phosphatase [Hyphomicrobium sp.]|uniref:trehalose-phosphatase n=1 Tax=Hyphomicrobium sp. TaxID=82 RepID=UPI0025C4652A|nr:trehalose-phosphatase [Hyphomicrobium sp.]MBZ0210163.1 trehalose-phosphatase [Hyphomicrobium sp.]
MKTVEQASLGEARGVDAKQQSPSELLAGDVRSYALFLDCDGTLLDIAPTPNEVRVPPGLVELLVRISKGLGGALAVLTGRQLAEIDTLLTPAKLVGAGVHGAELRTVSGGAIARVASTLPNSLVEEVMRRTQKLPGIIAEPKGPGLAVHYRLAPHLKNALETELRGLLTQYADALVLCHGRKLFEIVPAGHSKGTALETIWALPGFSGRRPIMIGDDIGDVPAFLAARRLGGTGLRVAGEQFGHQDVELQSPARVIAWLGYLAERLDG